MSDKINKCFLCIHNVIDKLVKNDKLNCIVKKVFSREIVMYLVFGVLTTVVNFVCFYVLFTLNNQTGTFPEKIGVHIANVTAWIVSVLFAFIVNKIFVFESKKMKPVIFFKELIMFVCARLVSLGVEEAGLFFFNNIIGIKAIPVKIIMAFVIVVLNYVFSKLLVFKKNK